MLLLLLPFYQQHAVPVATNQNMKQLAMASFVEAKALLQCYIPNPDYRVALHKDRAPSAPTGPAVVLYRSLHLLGDHVGAFNAAHNQAQDASPVSDVKAMHAAKDCLTPKAVGTDPPPLHYAITIMRRGARHQSVNKEVSDFIEKVCCCCMHLYPHLYTGAARDVPGPPGDP